MANADDFIDALRRLEDHSDVEPLVELFAQDASCDNITGTDPYEGPAGVRDFWSQDRALFDEIRSEFRNVIAVDDRVALEWTRSGKALDGGAVTYEGVSLLELSDGRVSRFKAYFDPRQVGRQVV